MIDFSSLKYRIDIIPETEKCIKRFPELMELAHIFDNSSDLPDDVTPDKVLRYLIYMYDPKTPLRTHIPDLKKRKTTALQLINVKADENGEVSDGFNQLCSLNATWAIQRFVHFCMLHDTGNLLIAETNHEAMARLSEKLLSDIAMGKAGDLRILRGEIDEARLAFEQAQARMHQDEINMRTIDYVKFTIRQNTLGIRPEQYIREYASRGNVFTHIIP
jgi:hypothetical protein